MDFDQIVQTGLGLGVVGSVVMLIRHNGDIRVLKSELVNRDHLEDQIAKAITPLIAEIQRLSRTVNDLKLIMASEGILDRREDP